MGVKKRIVDVVWSWAVRSSVVVGPITFTHWSGKPLIEISTEILIGRRDAEPDVKESALKYTSSLKLITTYCWGESFVRFILVAAGSLQ
jgi:hypothetical protein